MTSHHTLLLFSENEQETLFLCESFECKEYFVKNVTSIDHALDSIHGSIDNGEIVDGIILLANKISVVEEFFVAIHRSYPEISKILLLNLEHVSKMDSLINGPLVDKLLLMPIQDKQAKDLMAGLALKHKVLHQNVEYGKELQRLKEELNTVNITLESRIKSKAEELIKAIYYDELTGLASRALLKDRLDHAIEVAKRRHKKIAFFLVGLDRFKHINDSLGREAGDLVLREVSERVNKCVRASDTVCRFGGDVFGLMATDAERVEDPGFVAQRIIDSVSFPCKLEKQDVFLSCSIGICIYPDDGESASHLLANAETAMSQAKIGDSSRFRYYSGEFNQIAGKRFSLETELRKAIRNEEFVLYYQPRVDMEKHRVVGAEALLRWQHPVRGIVSPLEFLPILEEAGLIDEVGEWVINEAMQALNRWDKLSLPPIMLAVNLSARQFHEKRLPNTFQKLAKDNKIDLQKKRLEVEITESLLMEDVVSARAILLNLHEMGIKIAIDDFGTGYSALSYLIKFPLNYLKIDKSFVDRVHVSDDAKAIVEAIISLSYSLRLGVIAEGVESREQLIALQSLGCKQFQGFLFAKPLPEKIFVEKMSKDRVDSIANIDPEDRLLNNTYGVK